MTFVRLTACLAVLAVAAIDSGAAELPADLLDGLASEVFQDRETSENELLAWCRKKPKQSMPVLFDLSRKHSDPEVRSRCLDILKELVTDEYLREGGSGYIGIMMKEQRAEVPGDPQPRIGIVVTSVVPESPAHRVGLVPGDLIVGIDDHKWREFGATFAFQEEIKKFKPSTRIVLKLLRNDRVEEVPLILARRPPGVDHFDQTKEEIMESDRLAKERYFREWIARQKGEE